jgi:hypothetical protein
MRGAQRALLVPTHLPTEKPTMHKVMLIPAALAALLVVFPPASADTSAALKPFNVPFNTADDEDEPHVADNGLTIYYTSTKERKDEICVTERRRATLDWPGKGRILEDYVSSKGDDRSVFATGGRYPHFLYFASKRDEKNKNFDLFVAVKHEPGKAWAAPTPVMNVNTEADELHPWITPDGKSLYFSRKTPEGWRIFVSQRTSSSGPGGWQEPDQLDLPANFHHATLTPNGKTMYLQGPMEKFRWGLFVSTKTGKEWSKPKEVAGLNSTLSRVGDCSPNLTRDGRYLYFASDRPGGKGGLDIWGIETKMLGKK